jgi:hypothetical protein
MKKNKPSSSKNPFAPNPAKASSASLNPFELITLAAALDALEDYFEVEDSKLSWTDKDGKVLAQITSAGKTGK